MALYTPVITWITRAGPGGNRRIVQAIVLYASFLLDAALVTYLTVASLSLRGHIALAYVPLVLSLISFAPHRGAFRLGLAATISGYTLAGWTTEGRAMVFRDDMFWVHGVFIVLFVTSSHLFHKTVREREDLQRANEMLSRLSFKDALTGLFNRRHLDERLTEEVNRAERLNTPVAVLMADIDFFKIYNDTYGHDRGDGILRLVSEVMQANSRQHDVVCRYGGEEFALILPETDRRSMARRKVTISIGVAVFPENAVTVAELVQCADHALYEAKHRGRNAVVACETSPPTKGIPACPQKTLPG